MLIRYSVSQPWRVVRKSPFKNGLTSQSMLCAQDKGYNNLSNVFHFRIVSYAP